jgi:hypothetical protein
MVTGFREGRPPLDDDTWGIDHWPTQGALALTAAGVAIAVAAAVRARWSGTGVSAMCVAVAACWFGVSVGDLPEPCGQRGRGVGRRAHRLGGCVHCRRWLAARYRRAPATATGQGVTVPVDQHESTSESGTAPPQQAGVMWAMTSHHDEAARGSHRIGNPIVEAVLPRRADGGGEFRPHPLQLPTRWGRRQWQRQDPAMARST